MTIFSNSRAITGASYALTAVGLWIILHNGLLGALLAGLLVYSLVHLMAPPLMARRYSSDRARLIAVAALASFTVIIVTLAIWGAVSFFKSDAGSVTVLLQKLADIIEASRSQLPGWVIDRLPGDAASLQESITEWLREHSVEAKHIGQEAGRTAAHVLLGMIIGAMVALHDTTEHQRYLPLAAALRDRLTKLVDAFRQIVFAQVRISAINTVLTALYIFVALPLADVHLPLSKTLILVTFLAGFLPVIGNLISNSMIVIAGLAHSLPIAVSSLVFLVVIHKLEYFLNARIIGAHINARAWELLSAMLVMEAVFGLPGVVAAPVFYAYLKQELVDAKLV
ncbi:MAG: hypothetical protein HYS18_08525 [Burkholderiales bacterium]|nr:hypothetical protein [Burkholderiales bacterium]